MSKLHQWAQVAGVIMTGIGVVTFIIVGGCVAWKMIDSDKGTMIVYHPAESCGCEDEEEDDAE